MKPESGTRKPYTGTSRSLVLALDIGTTFSGVSYAILEPGEVPKIHGVTRFPGQEHVAGNSKIPSIMYYDKRGVMKAAGAEADGASVLAQAEDEGWIKTELFKLRLRPRTMTLKMNGMRLSSLPHGKSAVEVFGDFLQYLFRCTRSFIIDTHANGQALWHAVEHDVQLVLSHPNGWEGAQQTKMRRAAVYGGLIPDADEGKARIRFVTEGEASLHACVLNGLAADVLSNPSGHGFIVADAGGGTLDISTYAIRGTSPLVIEEIAPPDCVFAGSVFVSRRARAFFEEKLKNSKYGSPDSLDHITKRFDETTKRLFRDNKEMQFVPFGSPLDKDLTAGIRGGQLKLTGLEVAALFEPSVQAAVASIKAQIEASAGQVRSVWLVGGFAASPWLFSQLQEYLTPLGIVVSRPDTQTSKAVADGAIGFYCDHHVSARMSKFMYGVEYLREYDGSDDDHVSRKHRLFELPSGPKLLPDAFDCILARSVKVKESTVFSRKYCTEVTNLTTLSVFEVEIWCYRGGDTIPKWILRNADNFSTLCYVRADLSPLAGSAQSKQGRNGKTYWTIVFSIEIHFGLTEFRARIKWTDNGKTRYGPASIVYNEGGVRAEEDEPDILPDDEPNVYSHPHSEKHKSTGSSRAPSRDPVQSTSRSVSQSSHTPQVEFPTSKSVASTRRPSIDGGRIYDYERKPSLTSHPEEVNWRDREGGSRATSVADKGKERERSIVPESPRVADRMSERDRLANLSAKSTDSKTSVRTNGTARLSEQLTSVWGPAGASNAPSKQPTPAASPHVEPTHFDTVTPREIKTSIYANAAPTPKETKPATPQMYAKSPAPADTSSRSHLMSTASKVATPALASKIATPQVASKVATPAATPKVNTPQSRPTSVSLAPVTAPAPAPTWGSSSTASKAATPAPMSKAASKAAYNVPTPLSTSKVGTPRAMSKVNTPIVERSDPWGASTDGGASTPKPPTPRVEPVVPAFVEEHPPPVHVEPTPPAPKAPSPKVLTSSKVATPKISSPMVFDQHVEDTPADHPLHEFKNDLLQTSDPVSNSLFGGNDITVGAANTADSGWGYGADHHHNQNNLDEWGGDNNAGDNQNNFDWGEGNPEEEIKTGHDTKSNMNDLWEADKQTDTGGGFSDFLTKGGKWSPAGVSKNNSESGDKDKGKDNNTEQPVAPSLGFGFGGTSGSSRGSSNSKGLGTTGFGGWGASTAKSTASVFGDNVGPSSTSPDAPAHTNESAKTDAHSPKPKLTASPKPDTVVPPKLPTPIPSPKVDPVPVPPKETSWGAPVTKTPSWGAPAAKSGGWGSTGVGFGSTSTPTFAAAPEEPVKDAGESAEPAQPPASPKHDALKLDTTAAALDAQKDENPPPSTAAEDKTAEEAFAAATAGMNKAQIKKFRAQQAKEKEKKEKEEKEKKEKEEKEKKEKEEAEEKEKAEKEAKEQAEKDAQASAEVTNPEENKDTTDVNAPANLTEEKPDEGPKEGEGEGEEEDAAGGPVSRSASANAASGGAAAKKKKKKGKK